MLANKAMFIFHLFTYDCDYASIVREQYELCKTGISLTESSNLPDFERQVYINLLINDRNNEIEALKRPT